MAGILEILVWDQVMIKKRQQLAKLTDQLSKRLCQKQDYSIFSVLPMCLQFLWSCADFFLTKFSDFALFSKFQDFAGLQGH